MSFYKDNPLSYPNYEGVEGEEEGIVEEVLEEEEVKEGEGEEEEMVAEVLEEGS